MHAFKVNTTKITSDGKWLIQGTALMNALLKLMYTDDVKMD